MKASKEHKPQVSRNLKFSRSTKQCVRIISIETNLFGGNGIIHHQSHRKANLYGIGNHNIVYVDRGFWNRGVIPNQNQLQENELLIIVSHGHWRIPYFARKTPNALATELANSNIFRPNYHGTIYLNGCYTGAPGPRGTVGDGSSYAEKFKIALQNTQDNLGPFNVKGNLGAAYTSPGGRENIYLDETRTIRLINENINLVNPPGPYLSPFRDHIGIENNKYVTYSPFAQVTY